MGGALLIGIHEKRCAVEHNDVMNVQTADT